MSKNERFVSGYSLLVFVFFYAMNKGHSPTCFTSGTHSCFVVVIDGSVNIVQINSWAFRSLVTRLYLPAFFIIVFKSPFPLICFPEFTPFTLALHFVSLARTPLAFPRASSCWLEWKRSLLELTRAHSQPWLHWS